MMEKLIEKLDGDKLDLESLLNGEKGQSELFVEYHQDVIKITNSKGGYHFVGDSLLWEEKKMCYFVKLVVDFLFHFVSSKIREYAGDKSKNDLII